MGALCCVLHGALLRLSSFDRFLFVRSAAKGFAMNHFHNILVGIDLGTGIQPNVSCHAFNVRCWLKNLMNSNARSIPNRQMDP